MEHFAGGIRSSIRSSTGSINSRPCDLTTSRPLLTPYCSLPSTLVTTPYLPPKCLPIVSFVLPTSNIALPLTLQRTVVELYIRPIYLTEFIFFFSFIYYLSNLYIEEKKKSGSAPYCRYFCYCFRCSHYCFSLYFPPPYTARINLATTTHINSAIAAYINPAATYYSPPYRRAARLWPYYYYSPYYRAARY